MKKIKIAIMGCGARGNSAYGVIASTLPDMYEVVAIAEPIMERREIMQKRHNIPEEMCFSHWKDFAELPKCADAVIIAMQDYMHYQPAMTFINKGYDILLEKPIAPTPFQCEDIARAAEKNGTKILVCHVLRYTSFYKALKKLLLDGIIGEVRNITHTEAVGNEHQSHSFVRGNWRNSKETSPMILAKSCHDTDLIQWLMGSRCKKVQSFGELSYFNREHAPEGCADRCTDGCKYLDTCPYSAIKIYCDKSKWYRNVAFTTPNPTNEEIMEALITGPYGRCVFKCDNDVVDHQTLNMQFENGATATFTMSAFNEGGRYTRIMGTKGELFANMGDDHIDVFTFADRKHTQHKIDDVCRDISIAGGHGGGDSGIMIAFYELLTDSYKGFSICEIGISSENHLISFAAEHSRTNGGVTVDIEEFKSKL